MIDVLAGSGFPNCLLAMEALPHLESLNLSFHGIREVPDEISHLKSLKTLDISHNPQLESLSGDLSNITTFKCKEILIYNKVRSI